MKRIYIRGDSENIQPHVGESYGRNEKIIDMGKSHLIVARTFKNGHPKRTTKRVVTV